MKVFTTDGRRLRSYPIVQKCLLLLYNRPRLVLGAIVGLLIVSWIVKKYSINLDNYFKHQSDKERHLLLEKTCDQVASETRLNVSGRTDNKHASSPDEVNELVQMITAITNITRNYTVELLRTTLSCPTIDVARLKNVIQTDHSEHHLRNHSLPPAALTPRASVQYSQHWRGFKLPLIGGLPGGRLGNVMGEYATIFSLQKLYGVTAILTPELDRKLRSIFPQLSLPVVDIGNWREWIGLPSDKQLYPKYEALELASLGLLGPHRFLAYDFSFEMHLFYNFRHEVLKEFTFNSNTSKKVDDFYRRVREDFHSAKRSPKPIFIGVHLRYTDYIEYMRKIYNFTYSGYENYMRNAVNYYERLFDHPIYIVSSDDISSAQKVFNKLSISNIYYSRGSPSEDMAVLSRCNHSIITFGTYGFWTGFFTDGITLYPDIKTSRPYRHTKQMYDYAQILNFIPMPFMNT